MSNKNKKLIEDDLKLRKENIETLLKNHCSEPNHKFPTSRRELLQAGIISFGAKIFLPTMAQLFYSKASAQSTVHSTASGICPTSSSQFPGFVTLSPAGGAMLNGSIVGRNKFGQQLSSYKKLGMGGTAKDNIENIMGVDFYSKSSILAGIKSKATLETLGKVQLIHIINSSSNDTNNNNLDPSGLIMNAGFRGSVIANAGTGTGSGRARFFPALITPPQALAVRSPSDLVGAIGISGALKTELTAAQQAQLLKAIEGMSTSQARKLASTSTSKTNIEFLAKCATEKNTNLITSTVQGLNIADATLANGDAIRKVYGVTVNSAGSFNSGDPNTAQSATTLGSLVHASMNGLVGPVGFELGGYDYHAPNTRDAANIRDRELGVVIGNILQHASVIGKKVVINVLTDGGTGTPEADNSDSAQWSGDAEDCSASWMIFFDPAGKPALRDTKEGVPWQLGALNEFQKVDLSFFFAAKPGTLTAASIAANYLAFSGFSDSKIVASMAGSISSFQMDQVLRINKGA